MVDRKDVASWLDGPGARRPGAEADWPGSGLGLPQQGAGSVARFGRRLAAIAIDWVACLLVASLLFGVPLTGAGGSPKSWIPLAVFAVENVVLLSTIGSTFGHRLLGLRLRRVSGRAPSPVQVLIRTLLLCLAVPALIWDRDSRGLHDKAAETVLLRS